MLPVANGRGRGKGADPNHRIPSLILYKCSILNAHTNDTNGFYLITFYLGPVHSVKNLRKVRTEWGREGTTQVYLDVGLKIPRNN
jgi:hypothetical protein